MANFGSRDTLPVNRPLKRTNTISLIIFAIFVILYIGISAYAYAKGDLRKIKVYSNSEYKSDLEFGKRVLNELGRSKWLLLGVLCFSLVSTFVCLFIVRAISRIIIIIGLGMYLLMFGGLIWQLLLSIIHFNGAMFFNIVFRTFISACFIYVKIYAIMRVGTRPLSAFTKEACRSVFAFPFAMLLPIIGTVMIILVFINTGVAAFYLMTVSESTSAYLAILHLINIYTGLWLCGASGFFVLMTLFKIYGVWFYTLDKSEVPCDTILNSAVAVLRYHVGTIAYATSIVAPFVLIYMWIKNLSTIVRDTRHNIVVVVVSWLYVLAKLPDSTVGVCGIYGTSFKKTADRVCQMYLRHPLRVIAINQAFECCIAVLLILTMIVIIPGSYAFTFTNKQTTDEEVLAATIIILFAWLITAIPIILVLLTAVSALMYCMFEDFERCQENRNSTSFTKAQLKDLMEIE